MKLPFKLIVLFLSVSFAGSAQKDSTVKTNSPAPSNPKHLSVEQILFISGGVGVSTIDVAVFGLGGYGDYVLNNASPAYNFMLDAGVSKRFTIGFGICYQSLLVSYEPLSSPEQTQNISRMNFSFRVMWVFLSTRYFELYMGLRAGFSSWNDIATPQNVLGSSMLESNATNFSIQTPIGLRTTGHFGMHIELAIGTPYFAEAGLTFRIGKSPK